ncbi:MAG: hypothetical protein ACLRR3_04530 [Eubacterium sp.]
MPEIHYYMPGASEKCRVKKNDGKKGDSLKVIGKMREAIIM